jgi:hypothetical protein
MPNEVKSNVAAIDKIKPGNDGNFAWFQNFWRKADQAQICENDIRAKNN